MSPKAEARRRPVSVLAIKLWEIAQAMEERLDDPGEVLEMLVNSAAKGENAEEVWAALHRAAQQHDKTQELALHYEQVTHDKRVKLLAPEQQAFIFLKAAEFFADVHGDLEVAISFAERALSTVPGHGPAFARLESLLQATSRHVRLAQVYVAASERGTDREARLDLLRRAQQLAVSLDDGDELAIDAGRRILQLAPDDEAVREDVMRRLLGAGRHAEVIELLEQALEREPPPGPDEAKLHLELLVDLCSSVLKSPERALTHLEGLLRVDPTHEMALRAAEGLLEHKQLMPRAAAALSDAFQQAGNTERAVSMLTFELKHVRGPRRVDVQRRLGILRQDALGDLSGALELLAPVVAGDPGDDALRQRFVGLSLSLNQPEQAARLLSRALSTHRDPGVRARVGVDVGTVFLRSGDVKRAQAAFNKVLESASDSPSSLEAARKIAELFAEGTDVKQLASVLETIVRLEPEKEPRQAAARRLARLADEINDKPRALLAFRALVGSPWTDEALTRLEAAYREANDDVGLSDVFAFRAERAKDRVESQELAVKALDLRTAKVRDSEEAIAAYRGFAERFGPSRELHARLLPLLEQNGRFQEYAETLQAEIGLVEREERAQLFGRLGQIRLSRLSDARGALDAFREAVTLDPEERLARAGLERLLTIEPTRLAAATLLEPLVRASANSAEVLKVLEARAEAEESAQARLAVRDEAIFIAENELGERDRALEIAVRALRDALENEPDVANDWITVVARLAPNTTNPSRRAELLLWSIEDCEIASRELFDLARLAGDLAAAAGDLGRAVDVYRRALAFDPASRELVQRIDELLSQLGSPEDRLSLYATALGNESEPGRRRELLHALSRLQRLELGDREGAIATLRTLVAEDPKDASAHEALVDVLSEAEDYAALRIELERGLVFLEGERRTLAELDLADATERSGDAAAALGLYRRLFDELDLDDEVLGRIERLALAQGDDATLERVIERRLSIGVSPSARGELLVRQGELAIKGRKDGETAARLWLEAGRLAETQLEDRPRAREIYQRALGADSKRIEAAERLVELAAEAGDWDSVKSAFEALLASGKEREIANSLLSLEPSLEKAGKGRQFAKFVERALANAIDPARRSALLLAKARALSTVADAADEVATIFRGLIEARSDELTNPAVDAFSEFLRRAERTRARIADLRWLFAVRVARASDPIGVLFEWARAEDQHVGDRAAAIAVYERVLAADPDQIEAWTELARLRAAAGDAKEAMRALEALSERSDPEARLAIDLSKASLLVGELGKPAEALALVRQILATNPSDPTALGIVHRTLLLPETRAEAARLLEAAAESADDPAGRAQAIEALLAVSADDDQLAEARSRWLAQLLETKSGDPEEALRIALRGAETSPGEEEFWRFAEQMARKLERPLPVAEAYSRALARQLELDVAERVGRRMIDFHEEWFDDAEQAIKLLGRVLSLVPEASWAFDRLKLAFNAAGRWPELFELYDSRLAFGLERAERIEILREAAMAARDFADDSERAIGYLEALNRETPNDARVEASLERLYERLDKKRKLIDLLSARLAQLDGSSGGELSERIAKLWLDLSEPGPALALGEALLREPARRLPAVALLERLIALPEARAGEQPTPLRRAIEHLKKHYADSKNLLDLVRVLEIEKGVAESVVERRELLERIATLRQNDLEDYLGAFQTLSELVLLDSASTAYRKQLGELARRVDHDLQRVEVLVSAAKAGAAPEVRSSLLNEAAAVRRHSLNDEAGAIELYREVLALHGAPKRALLEAARELTELLRQGGEPAERVQVLERLADLEKSRDARRGALGEAAELAFRELGDAPRAIAAYRKRLADDADDLEAMDGLVVALEATGQWPELISALEVRAALLPNDAAKRDRVRIATVYSDVQHDRKRAIDAWRHVVELYGSDRQSFEALFALLSTEERWQELALLLTLEIESEGERERRRTLELELGALHEHRTGERVLALEAYVAAEEWQAAIRVAGGVHADRAIGQRVCARLLELATSVWLASGEGPSSAPARAADWALGELAERLLEDGEYAAVVERLLSGSDLPFEALRRRELRRDAACLLADRLGDASRATDLFQGLLAEDPSDPVAVASVTRLALLLEEQSRSSDLVRLWEDQARARTSAGDVAAAQVLWARAGELAETRLLDREAALAAYSAGAEIGGEACLEALARVYASSGELESSARALERLCAQSSGTSLGPRALQLAETYVLLGRRGRAREALEQALPRVVDGSSLRARLATLYREAHDYAALAALLEDEANRAAEPRAKLALLSEAAELHLDRRGEPAPAVPLLERAVALAPDEAKLRLRLAQALIECTRYEDAVTVLRDQLTRFGSRRPKERALVHYELARALLASGERPLALDELDAASKIDPAHPTIMRALARTALDQGELERSERMYRALLLVANREQQGSEASRAEALLALAEIAERRGDSGRAREFEQTAFESAMESPREAQLLERTLRTRGRPELSARALEISMGHGLPAPDAARSLLHLTELHASIGDFSHAREDLEGRANAVSAELESLESNDDGAWAALGRVYELLGDPTKEALVLERRILRAARSSRPPADPQLLYRLARARVTDPETVEQGLDLIERCLDGGLELEQAQELVSQAASTRATSRRVPALLERIARARGDRPAIARALLHRAENHDIDVAALREGIALADELGDSAIAERLLALSLDGGRLDADPAEAAWLRLESAGRARARGDLVRANQLEEAAASYMEADRARELLLRVAAEALDPIGDLPRALQLYEELRSEAPADPELFRPLIGLYRRLGQPDRAAALLAETAALIEEPAQQLAMRLEQTKLLVDLEQRDQAISVLRDVVRDEPGHGGAAQRLAELLEAAGREEDLIELLQAQVDAAKDRGDVPVLVRHSQRLSLLLERRGRVHAAIDACRAALDWDPPESHELLETLVRLTQVAGDPVELADALEALLGVERGPTAPALARKLAAVRQELGDPVGVERALELGFAACPSDKELSELLAERYRQRGEPARVAEVLDRALQARPDDPELVDRLIDAQRQAGMHGEALAVTDRLLARGAPTATLLRQRALILGELARDSEAVAALEQAYALDSALLPDLIAGLERAVARSSEPRLFAVRLIDLFEATGNLPEARARLSEQVALTSEDRTLLARLAALDFKMENFEQAAIEYGELAAIEEGEGLVHAALQLSDVCERIGRPGEAREVLDRAMAFDRANPELRARLLKLLEASGNSDEYAEMLVEEASHETDVGARAAKLLRAGEIYLGAAGGGPNAVIVLEAVREMAAESLETVVLLARAYAQTERLADAAQLLHATVEANRGKRSRGLAAVYEELAEVHLAEGYLTDALQALQRSFEMDSRNARLGMRLAQLALEAEEDEVAQRGFRAVAIMKSAAVDGPEGARPETKAEANYALAVLARKAGDARRARVLVSKALGDFPDHAEAKALLAELDQK